VLLCGRKHCGKFQGTSPPFGLTKPTNVCQHGGYVTFDIGHVHHNCSLPIIQSETCANSVSKAVSIHTSVSSVCHVHALSQCDRAQSAMLPLSLVFEQSSPVRAFPQAAVKTRCMVPGVDKLRSLKVIHLARVTVHVDTVSGSCSARLDTPH
jgi:hypothetical protein